MKFWEFLDQLNHFGSQVRQFSMQLVAIIKPDNRNGMEKYSSWDPGYFSRYRDKLDCWVRSLLEARYFSILHSALATPGAHPGS
jgi:hypothetical protein